MQLSVVIITKNEARVIGNTLESTRRLTDDVVVVDSGSTDGTLDICQQFGARIVATGWDGYGNNKNKGSAAARHDWIFSLDADEAIDEELKSSLQKISLQKENVVYQFRRRNFFCGKEIKHGEWGRDKVRRIYNKNMVSWNEADVHEELVSKEVTITREIKGSLLHYTAQDRNAYESKTDRYAQLSAKKYKEKGKKASLVKRFVSPAISFISNYVFRLGFLDGKEGYIIAMNTARYTFLKYKYLSEL